MNIKTISCKVLKKREATDKIAHVVIKERGHSRTDAKSYIECPKIKSQLDLLAYLHELGHCKSKQPDFMDAISLNPVVYDEILKCSRYSWVDARLYCEYNAWNWALKYFNRLGFKLQPVHKKMVAGYFGNYLYGAVNKDLAKDLASKMRMKFAINVQHDKFYEGY